MKRRICFLVFVAILCCACGNSKAVADDNSNDSVTFNSGSYFLKFWNITDYNTYDYDAIPNKETALAVAKEIWEGIPKSNRKQQYTAQEVFFDEEDEVWIITFGDDVPSAGPISTGNCCSIAIQKKDSKILSIWFGE